MLYRGAEQRTALLVPPSLANSTCGAVRYSSSAAASAAAATAGVSFGDVAQATIILLLSLGVVGANLMLVVVINSRRYSKYIHEQPRYLLTSLASNDLAIGLLVTPFALVPSVNHCWPFGEIVCQIQ
ncbi:Trace amine-associated receptor 1, partial [Frankliniella fusca]